MILVFGKTGQVAMELARRLPNARFLSRNDVDLKDAEACGRIILESDAEAVINAAAYTAVDRAEEEEDLVTTVNGISPIAMAVACNEKRIPFLHISTDYVFDGSGETPFTVEAPTAPLGAYGRSKLVGEKGVRMAGGITAILRTSWIVSSYGNNFVKTMLRLSETRDRLTIVADQVGGPTCAADIAEACITIVTQLKTAPEKSGTYHFSGGPNVSWAEFAREIFAQMSRQVEVTNIPSSAYPTLARRPGNSRLDNSETEAVFGISRPDWRRGLRDILSELDGR
ncbi:dTDP-4-dehydrorhamnose reductase [Sagittula sp. NFXS13]|uniref:dTDP-4-dehydrorhamnose reductase n=1 Tax=Sagittula sp. NFXS13 TaxID=2819095 RepID=UPI0032DF2D29